jgi:hypothetical protein
MGLALPRQVRRSHYIVQLHYTLNNQHPHPPKDFFNQRRAAIHLRVGLLGMLNGGSVAAYRTNFQL